MGNHIRTIDVAEAGEAACRDACDRIYGDQLDAVIVRGLFPAAAVATVQSRLAAGGLEEGWHRPNQPVPGIDLRLLGEGATPTATAPTGPTRDTYFDEAERSRDTIRGLFANDIDPFQQIEAGLALIGGGRPVEVPANVDGRPFAASTVRSLPHGQGLLLHHDYHYPLPIYGDLAPRLDTTTCISFFVVLQNPEGGGRLCVYALKPNEEGDLPRLPHGMLDPREVDARVEHTFFDLREGDLIAFGSGRLYHRVEPVVGKRSRVTMGGFLAFDKAHARLLYWS